MPTNQITTTTTTNNNNSHMSKGNRMHPYLASIHWDMNQTYEALQAKIQRSRMLSAQTATNNKSTTATTMQEPMVLFSNTVESLLKQLSDYQATQTNAFQQQLIEPITNSNATQQSKAPAQLLTTASTTTTTITTKSSSTSSPTSSSSSSSSTSTSAPMTPKVGPGGYVALVKGRLPQNERQYRLDHGLCMYCGITKHALWNCPKLQAKDDKYFAHLSSSYSSSFSASIRRGSY